MFGNTITLDISAGGSSTPEEIILTKINQDGYSSEYRLKESDRDHVLFIRHSKEKSKVKGQEVERHNVTYTQNYFPTELYPQGRSVQAYCVIRNAPADPIEAVDSVHQAVTRLAQAEATKLLSWQS